MRKKQNQVDVKLEPSGKTLTVAHGTALQDILFGEGIEFPCGGHGTCKKCLVRVIDGVLSINALQRQRLTEQQLAEGWRLACQCRISDPVSLQLAQWNMDVLVTDAEISENFRPGLGIAVDLGTTTLVTQLVDLQNGRTLSVRSTLNPQAQYGADVMSRIEQAASGNRRALLRDLIRGKILAMIQSMLSEKQAEGSVLDEVDIVGNTAMYHLFGDIDTSPLSRYPFNPVLKSELSWSADALGWSFPGNPQVRFLPCLGGFVGSDILVGILATEMQHSKEWQILIDLGTNGEIVIGNTDQLICASTAAGPAFEGARIRQGMRAETGAIDGVSIQQDRLRCHVLGGGEARGICGSGLVDAVAAGLALGDVLSSGKLLNEALHLTKYVAISQADIRELQLAKAAIAAGIDLILKKLNLTKSDISKVYLAGAFGNYVGLDSARRIGLLDFLPGQIEQIGNAALQGAKLALFIPGGFDQLLNRVEHFPLADDPEFQEVFVANMLFPA